MTDSYTILHVEDNLENRVLVRRLLMAAGFTVVDAENARKAIDLVKDLHPDAVLMDINMPDIDGYTLTAQMRQIPHLAAVPIIALTANVMRGDREKSIQAGCDGYIEKPIDVDTFIDHINRFVKR